LGDPLKPLCHHARDKYGAKPAQRKIPLAIPERNEGRIRRRIGLAFFADFRSPRTLSESLQ